MKTIALCTPCSLGTDDRRSYSSTSSRRANFGASQIKESPVDKGWDSEAPFHFVDGVEAAVAKTQELAGRSTRSTCWRILTW